MEAWKERTVMLIGADAAARLAGATVVVAGLGGVGGMAAEMLARAGVGHLVLIDADTVSETNINRQLPALHSTVGRPKAEVVAARLQDINPALKLDLVQQYLTEDSIPSVLDRFAPWAVVDAIDTLSPKIALIRYCLARGLFLVSSMGSGAKFDSTAVRIADISRTKECPLARMLRKRLHKFGITEGFLAVYSAEKPVKESVVLEESRNKKSQTGTISWMPASFGIACAQAAVLEIAALAEPGPEL